MNSIKRLVIVITGALSITSCSTSIHEYQHEQPALNMSEFFSGQLSASGIVQDYSDKVTRRFTADIVGYWEGNRGVLDEIFYFADGTQETRCWRLTQNDAQLTGTAEDVKGEAFGTISGNALRWQYQLVTLYQGSALTLSLDDWLYQIDDNNMINRTRLTKFGIEVGQVTLHIGKVSEKAKRPLSSNCQLNN